MASHGERCLCAPCLRDAPFPEAGDLIHVIACALHSERMANLVAVDKRRDYPLALGVRWQEAPRVSQPLITEAIPRGVMTGVDERLGDDEAQFGKDAIGFRVIAPEPLDANELLLK